MYASSGMWHWDLYDITMSSSKNHDCSALDLYEVPDMNSEGIGIYWDVKKSRIHRALEGS